MGLKSGSLVNGPVVQSIPFKRESNPLLFDIGARWAAQVVSAEGEASGHLLDIESYIHCLEDMVARGAVSKEENAALLALIPAELEALGMMVGFDQILKRAVELADMELMEQASFEECTCGVLEFKHGLIRVGGRVGEKTYSMKALFGQCESYVANGTFSSVQAFGILKQAHELGVPKESPVPAMSVRDGGLRVFQVDPDALLNMIFGRGSRGDAPFDRVDPGDGGADRW